MGSIEAMNEQEILERFSRFLEEATLTPEVLDDVDAYAQAHKEHFIKLETELLRHTGTKPKVIQGLIDQFVRVLRGEGEIETSLRIESLQEKLRAMHGVYCQEISESRKKSRKQKKAKKKALIQGMVKGTVGAAMLLANATESLALPPALLSYLSGLNNFIDAHGKLTDHS